MFSTIDIDTEVLNKIPCAVTLATLPEAEVDAPSLGTTLMINGAPYLVGFGLYLLGVPAPAAVALCLLLGAGALVWWHRRETISRRTWERTREALWLRAADEVQDLEKLVPNALRRAAQAHRRAVLDQPLVAADLLDYEHLKSDPAIYARVAIAIQQISKATSGHPFNVSSKENRHG